MLYNNIKLYYLLKPLIPRRFQILLRRRRAYTKRSLYKDTWPINEEANKKPDGWSGWPGNKQFALVLTHDVETKKGLANCYDLIELEKRLGFKSSFNFVAEDYQVPAELRQYLLKNGFEVGIHGLNHDGRLYSSRTIFQEQAKRINRYLKEWNSVGFRSPSMHYNLEWIHGLDIEYDTSTFDTDPFEPQPHGVGTIFPFWIPNGSNGRGYVELPYTLPQDFTLFILMKEKNIDIWKKKLDWIVEKGGMALLITHPDYMNGNNGRCTIEEYPMHFYKELLDYVKVKYEGQYWNPLPKELAHFWKEKIVGKGAEKAIRKLEVTYGKAL